MSTFEQRLQTVEHGLTQFRTETIKAYQGVAMELAMVKGLTTDSVKRLTALKMQMDQHFDTTNQRIAEVKQDVTLQIAEVKQDVTLQIAGVKQDVNNLHQRFDSLENFFLIVCFLHK